MFLGRGYRSYHDEWQHHRSLNKLESPLSFFSLILHSIFPPSWSKSSLLFQNPNQSPFFFSFHCWLSLSLSLSFLLAAGNFKWGLCVLCVCVFFWGCYFLCRCRQRRRSQGQVFTPWGPLTDKVATRRRRRCYSSRQPQRTKRHLDSSVFFTAFKSA